MRTKLLIVLAISLILPVPAFPQREKKTLVKEENRTVKASNAVLWRNPQRIATRDVFYGSGGKAGQPVGRYRFIEEDKGGTSPKFVVEDARGVRWKVKLGREAQSETAAARLVWAAGYFTDDLYYLPTARIDGMKKLSRGQEFVSATGVVQRARFERVDKSIKKIGDWSWYDNPFVGTREFDGLRVMMALINNWDLKQANNGILNVRGQELRYLVTDLGATLGKTGGNWSRSKNDWEDFVRSDFIEEVEPTTVDLVMRTRPPVVYAVAVPYYYKRSRMENITEDIPHEHARWIGRLLAGLSTEQIRDAFEAAGYTTYEINVYTREIRERIQRLARL
jgi:hypothetical protein